MSTHPFIGKNDYAFSVCRIEPENNIHVILDAFSKGPAMHLVIVGNWEHSEYAQNLKQKYSSVAHIHLLDPIYDQSELNELRTHCVIYLHGHSCGGTNPSLVEAMYWGLPIAAYNVNFNRATTEGKALYFRTSEELFSLIGSADRAALAEIGKNMREIAERRYTWARIARLYAELF